MIRAIALTLALAFAMPTFAFAASKAHRHKTSQHKAGRKPADRSRSTADRSRTHSDRKKPQTGKKTVEAKVTVNGNYSRGKDKKLEKIVAVASVPLSQFGKAKGRKKGDVQLIITEGKNGKRKFARKNLEKSSDLYNKLKITLEESIEYYKQNHHAHVPAHSSSKK